MTSPPLNQFKEQLESIVGNNLVEEEDYSDTSVDEMLDDVLARVEDYRPKSERNIEVRPSSKTLKPNLKTKTSLYSSIMKGLEPHSDDSRKVRIESEELEKKVDSPARAFEFLPANLEEDALMKQEWKQKNLMRDLIEEIEGKISER